MYNPSNFRAQNIPFGTSDNPLGAKSYYLDPNLFVLRPYQSVAQVNGYLAANFRDPTFEVIINTGGTLDVNTGKITGGTNDAYWYKNGTAPEDLILKSVNAYSKTEVDSMLGAMQASILIISEALAQETEDRISNIDTLSVQVSSVDSSLNAEISRAVNAEIELSSQILSEKNRAISVEETKADKSSISEVKEIKYSDLDASKSTYTNIDYANKTVYLVDTISGTWIGSKTFNSSGVLDLGFTAQPEFIGLIFGTIGDLSNYLSKSIIFSSQIFGLTAFSAPYSTAATNGNIYMNRGEYSLIYGHLDYLNIITSNAGIFNLVHFKRFADVYRDVSSFVINTQFVSDSQVQRIDIKSLNIFVDPGDTFGIQLLSGTTGRVRTKSRAGESSYISAPDLSTHFTIPADQIVSKGTPNNIGITFNVEIQGQAINDGNTRDDLIEKQTGDAPLMLNMGRMGIHSSYTNSTTAAFIIANSDFLQPMISGVFLYPCIVDEVSFITDFPSGTESANVFLIVLNKVDSDKWEESRRVTISCVEGLNTISLSGLNVEGEINGTLAIYSNTAGVNFSYKNVLDGYHFYSATQVNDKFTLVSGTFPDSPEEPNKIAMNFTAKLSVRNLSDRISTIERKGAVDVELTDRVVVLESDVAEIKSELNLSPNTGNVLFDGNLAITGDDWVNTTWSLVSGELIPTSTGLANYIMFNREYALDRRMMRLRIRLGSGSRFAILTKPLSTNANQSSMVECDASSGQIKIYNAFSGGTTLPAVLNSMNYSFQTDRDYILEYSIDKNEFKNSLKVTDGLTGDFVELVDTSRLAGRQHDCYSFVWLGGAAPIVKDMEVWTPVTGDLAMGDSIHEAMGNSVTVVDGFAQQIIRKQNNNGGVSGRGSCNIDSIKRRFFSEVLYINPKRMELMIGTNAGNTRAKLAEIAQLCRDNNIKLYLNRIPRRGDQSTTDRNNDIDSVVQEFGLESAKMDIPTSLNYDPSQSFNPDRFFDDEIHPLNFGGGGTPFMFNRTLLDTPSLYY